MKRLRAIVRAVSRIAAVPRFAVLCGASIGLCTLAGGLAKAAFAPAYDVEEKYVTQLASDLRNRNVSSERLVRAYLARIAAVDARGPALHSVIALIPRALAEAPAADASRRAARSPPQGRGCGRTRQDELVGMGEYPVGAFA